MKSFVTFLFIILLVNLCVAQEKIQICYDINDDTVIVGYHSEVDIGAVTLWFHYAGYQIDTVESLEPAQNMDLWYGDTLGMLRILLWNLQGKIIPKGTDYLLLIYLSEEGSILLDTVEASDPLANTLTYEEVDCSELGQVDCPELEEDENLSSPQNFTLFQNYPNPFNPYTTLSYELKHELFVRLEIYDIQGRKVKTLISERQTPGFKNVIWDGKDNDKKSLPSGVYLYRLKAGDQKKTKKMIFLK